MTFVKICGMRSQEDIECSRDADYLGFIVESESVRTLSKDLAGDLMSVCGNRKVMVTTCREMDKIESLISVLEPDVVQLHYPPSNGISERFRSTGVEIWGALGVGKDHEHVEESSMIGYSAMVLDTPGPGSGGTGRTHDWNVSRGIADRIRPIPVILAGGLGPDNVRAAMETVHPYAVDASSRLEVGEGKDPSRVRDFISEVRRFDEDDGPQIR